MADNFKTLQQDIVDKINNAGGPGSIPSEEHRNILLDLLTKVGKYTGIPYKARRTPNNGLVPSGTFFWNNNALNNTNNFVVTFASNNSDLNPIELHLNRLTKGSLIHFKDYSGRSGYFVYDSHVKTTDSGSSEIFNVTMNAIANNPVYEYQASDDEICVFEFFTASSNYVQFGSLTIRQSEANNTAGTIGLTAGDFCEGALNDDKYLNFGIYEAGDPLEDTSYDQDTIDLFDPNE